MSAVAILGIAAGSLAGASGSFAAPQAAQHTVSSQRVSPLAVNNLGLSKTQAEQWQCELRSDGFSPGTIDGQLGTSSWEAAQKFFNKYGLGIDGKLSVDGVVGTETIKALQNYLNSEGANLVIDGVAGSATEAAFAHFNNVHRC